MSEDNSAQINHGNQQRTKFVDINSINERIEKVIGFDPIKNNPTRAIFESVLLEVQEEENELKRAKAKEVYKKVLEARRTQHKVDQEYQKVAREFEKTINKLLSSIAYTAGGSTQDSTGNTST